MSHIMLYDTGDARNEYNEPLGIEVIAAKLIQRFGQELPVELLWHSRDGLPVLSDRRLDILGISLHIGQLDVFRQLYEAVRLLPHKPLIFVGNVGATYGYERLLREYPEIICILGEGEETFVQIVEAVQTHSLHLAKINNLAYWENGGILLTQRQTANLAEYVEPVRQFTDFLHAQKGIVRVEGSRGCSWHRCSFCCINHKYNGAPWRPIPVETVIAQIEDLAVAAFRSVYFTDEDFVGSCPDRLETLIARLEEVRRNNEAVRKMNYFISIRASDLLNNRIFALLQRFSQAGLREIFVGIESGCSSQLTRYRKGVTREKNRQALIRAHALNADVDIGFILFDPETTVEELEENIRFIEETALYQYGANFIKRLRIQPFTQAVEIFRGQARDFDLERLEYRYQFKDPRIQRIYDLYMQQNADDTIYQVQNAYRGEVPSPAARQEQKDKLVEIRKKQLDALKEIVRSVMAETTREKSPLPTEFSM